MALRCGWGCRTNHTRACGRHSKRLERRTRAGESPVEHSCCGPGWYPEYHEARETLWEAGGTTLQG